MNDGHANPLDLEAQSLAMARNATREREADEWIEGLIADTRTEI